MGRISKPSGVGRFCNTEASGQLQKCVTQPLPENIPANRNADLLGKQMHQTTRGQINGICQIFRCDYLFGQVFFDPGYAVRNPLIQLIGRVDTWPAGYDFPDLTSNIAIQLLINKRFQLPLQCTHRSLDACGISNGPFDLKFRVQPDHKHLTPAGEPNLMGKIRRYKEGSNPL